MAVAAIRSLEAGALSGQPRHPLAGRGAALGYDASVARAAPLRARLAERGEDSLATAAIRYALGEPAVTTVVLGFSPADVSPVCTD